MKTVKFWYNTILELIYGKDYKRKKMEKLLNLVITNLSQTQYPNVVDFKISENQVTFKYCGADMILNKEIIKMDNDTVGVITLYNYSKIPFTGTNLIKIDPFDLYVFSNQSVKIKNYIKFNNPMSVTIDQHGYIFSNIHTIQNTYFKQMESMLIEKQTRLTIN